MNFWVTVFSQSTQQSWFAVGWDLTLVPQELNSVPLNPNVLKVTRSTHLKRIDRMQSGKTIAAMITLRPTCYCKVLCITSQRSCDYFGKYV